MPRRHRSRPGAGRAERQARQIGNEIRLGRLGLALSMRQLHRKAGVSISTVGRIERGEPGAQLDTLVAVGAAVGVDVVVRAYPGPTPRLRDTGQLILAEQLARVANSRWRPSLEVPAGDHGRAADLIFWGPDEILHVEVERAVIDFQAQYRAAQAKRDFLAGVHARPVRLVLAVEDSARNRAALRPHQELISAQLPAGSRQVLAALRSGRPLGRDGLVWVRRRPLARTG